MTRLSVVLSVLLLCLNDGVRLSNSVPTKRFINFYRSHTCPIKTNNDLDFCDLANKMWNDVVDIGWVTDTEKSPASGYAASEHLKYVEFTHRRSTWVRRKDPNGAKTYTLNGLIDNIRIYATGACYIAVGDYKNSDNGYKFHKVRDSDTCARSIDFLLNGDYVIASAEFDEVLNFSNDITSLESVRAKLKNQFATVCGLKKRLRKRKRNIESRDLEMGIDMAVLLALYAYLPFVRVQNFISSNQPITSMGIIDVPSQNGNIELPAFISTRILSNQRIEQRRGWTSEVHQKMQTMGMLIGDELGHLIARELGGSQDVLNIVPMAGHTNRHMSSGADSIEPNKLVNPNGLQCKANMQDMRYPLSVWRSNEQFIRTFLDCNPGGFVDYTVAVLYNDEILRSQSARDLRAINIQNGDLRPTHFMQQFTMHYANGTVVRYNPVVSINDNDFQCSNTEQSLE